MEFPKVEKALKDQAPGVFREFLGRLGAAGFSWEPLGIPPSPEPQNSHEPTDPLSESASQRALEAPRDRGKDPLTLCCSQHFIQEMKSFCQLTADLSQASLQQLVDVGEWVGRGSWGALEGAKLGLVGLWGVYRALAF